jgi:hypothetical protein
VGIALGVSTAATLSSGEKLPGPKALHAQLESLLVKPLTATQLCRRALPAWQCTCHFSGKWKKHAKSTAISTVHQAKQQEEYAKK